MQARAVEDSYWSAGMSDGAFGGSAPNGQSVDGVGRPDIISKIVEPVCEPVIETVLEPVGEVGIERVTLRQSAAGSVSRGSQQARGFAAVTFSQVAGQD